MAEAIRQGDIPGVQLRCRRALGASRARVWPRLTQAAALEEWLCHRVRMPCAPGEELEWRGEEELGPGSVEQGTLLVIEPRRRWVATLRQPGWEAATRLEVELSDAEEGCEISVLQSGFEQLALSKSLTVWEAYRRRWRAALDRLAEALRQRA